MSDAKLLAQLAQTPDGDECPVCQNGTVEHHEGYVTCCGECGSTIRITPPYSAEKVHKWLADFQRLFLVYPDDVEVTHIFNDAVAKEPDYQAMVRYWAFLAYGVDDGTNEVPYAAQLCVDEGELSLNETWEEMSTWERANVLFGLIPIIETCASDAAKRVAAEARKEDGQ